jgi:long-chain acyl-CoA synthetase
VEVEIRDTEGRLLRQGEEGEICVRSPAVMTGYLNNHEGTVGAFWDGGWLRTGDIGVFDENDFVTIVDRLKDLVITGGENVYPREVEEALYTLPDVEECAVVGFPDREWGERLTAFIVPKAGRAIEPEAIRALLKPKLSPFKIPKEYVVMKDMPKSPAGKILKRELKKQFGTH